MVCIYILSFYYKITTHNKKIIEHNTRK